MVYKFYPYSRAEDTSYNIRKEAIGYHPLTTFDKDIFVFLIRTMAYLFSIERGNMFIILVIMIHVFLAY